ncbi:MAG TPA: TetR/AcrR family transcriptional regulator [Pseudonocardia sp.]
MSTPEARGDGGGAVRGRILNAAFSAFLETGYAETTTLEIARRAKVSKRELYALVGNKQEMLLACIRERADRLRLPADLPKPRDRDALERALVAFGTQLLRETTNATVIAAFRLAIGEAARTPEVAAALDTVGRQSGRAALAGIMSDARSRGLLTGRPAEMAEQFASLLWGDLMVSLLLRTVDTPTHVEVVRRARAAATAILQLHSQAP